MFLPYLFAFIIHGVFSVPPCEDGVEMISTETKNPGDLLGNWTHVFHWDPKKERYDFLKEFLDYDDHQFECPQLHFEAITPEFVKAKEAECAKHKMPFNWADAKLKVDAPALINKDAFITIGEKENWVAVDCTTMFRVVFKKVSDDYIAMVNPDENSESELIVRELPTLDELKCIAHNLDFGKGMFGLRVCYKK